MIILQMVLVEWHKTTLIVMMLNLNRKSANFEEKQYSIKIITRKIKNGLIPAISEGVRSSHGDYVLIMDADFSIHLKCYQK